MTQPDIPEGFVPHFRKSLFTDPWEPLFSKVTSDHVSIGTRLRDVHCNSRGLVHGGFVSAIADNAMGLTCAACLNSVNREFSSLVTISLNVDFVGLASLGQWFEAESEVVKLTGQLGFVNGLLLADGELVARATSTFKIG